MNKLTRLASFFTAEGYTSPDIALLQPAEPFLDTAGEDMRRRIFMTSDRNGRNLCLRPEFTIPVCMDHLKSGAQNGRYAYGGSVFRQSVGGAAEFVQAGVELIGADRCAQTDVDCISTAVDALADCGLNKVRIVFGDQAIFEALLGALDLPAAWRDKLARAFGDSDKLNNDLSSIANSDEGAISNLSPQLQKALADENMDGVVALIEEKTTAANLPAKGGRTATHIAERLMIKAQLAASQLSDAQREILTAFLRLEFPVAHAAQELRKFAHDAELNLTEEIDIFSRRCEMLQAIASKDIEINWRAKFGRRLDYYTGIVFEIFPARGDEPVCGGGRYDHLLGMLGASAPVPAIGFSIRLDRLEGDAS